VAERNGMSKTNKATNNYFNFRIPQDADRECIFDIYSQFSTILNNDTYFSDMKKNNLIVLVFPLLFSGYPLFAQTQKEFTSDEILTCFQSDSPSR
jgi:hypothetical protein